MTNDSSNQHQSHPYLNLIDLALKAEDCGKQVLATFWRNVARQNCLLARRRAMFEAYVARADRDDSSMRAWIQAARHQNRLAMEAVRAT